MGGPAVDIEEGAERHGRDQRAGDDRGRQPAEARPLDRGGGGGREERAEAQLGQRPDRAAGAALAVADGEDRQRQSEGGDWQVEQEHAGPAEMADHERPGARPDRQRDAVDRGPGRHGTRPLAGLGKGRRHDRERRRDLDRRADALDGAPEDQHRNRAGEAAQERAEGEDHEARDQHALVADAVAEHAAARQEGGVDQRIGVHDPLLAGEPAADVALDARQSEVRDHEVELNQE